ncbi:MAG: S1C family serine protease, partial [Tepidisphaeraceae bacterium]
MSRFKRFLTGVTLFGAAVAAGFFGVEVVRNAQFAHAQQKIDTTREQLAQIEDLATVFREVGKALEPSVVNINVKKTSKNGAGEGGRRRGLPFDDDTLRRFFPDRDGDGEPDFPPGLREGLPEEFEQFGTGSGVIMEAGEDFGYIVTNNHVAGGATELEITLHDGRQIDKAKVVGADPKSDLALIRVEADRLIPAKWGDSDDLQKGDWILAFGSPFGYIGSMTHGIVSALNRDVGILRSQMGYESFIQVDAPINPGNSGGPLVSVRGEVVGINTAIASRTGGFQGIGFAIPSNQAKMIYNQLKEKGKVTRGWLGVSISDVAKDLPKAQSFDYPGTEGVLVEQTFQDTPATGKLQAGDIITALNGKEIENVQQLRNAIAATAPGTDTTFRVYREGKEQEVALK